MLDNSEVGHLCLLHHVALELDLYEVLKLTMQ